MDDLDQHLLARLRENARAPVAELARGLGLSRTTIQSRLARLERNGTIVGYSVKLSDAAQGGLVHALALLTIEARQAAEIAAALKRLEGVRRLQSVSGPCDLIATLEAAGMGGIDALLSAIAQVKGVERVQSALVLADKFDR